MRTIPVDDGQFQISIERGGRYQLPHGFILGRKGKGILDASQMRRLVFILRVGHGNAFRTAFSGRVYRCWAATFRWVCHFMISLLRRPGMLIMPSAWGVERPWKSVSMVKLMSPRSTQQSASAYEINGAISEIAKSGLILMGIHLDGCTGQAVERLRKYLGRISDNQLRLPGSPLSASSRAIAIRTSSGKFPACILDMMLAR